MASNIHETQFFPNPLQKQFIESRAEADLFSSRVGEGKSTALAWAIYYHTRHNPGAIWAVIRDTWVNLEQTTMKTFFEWFPPGVFGSYKASTKTFTWAEGVAHGEVQFLGMDDQADATRLMSRELAGFAMDEPAPAISSGGIDEMIFDIGLTRLRQSGMKWYGVKLAENNPDETHWTYRRFVTDKNPKFHIWQPSIPENVANLPPGYYETLRRSLQHRPDLVRRFVEGDFGFQSIGKAVTPQWSDKIHLAQGLYPLERSGLIMLWDFGLNPTCIITQRSPLGYWLILDAAVGEGIGVVELIGDVIKPLLLDRYPKYVGTRAVASLQHIGDPAGKEREQTSSARSAVKSIKAEIGGTWRDGPVQVYERINPLQAVLARTLGGKGVVQVDRDRATPVWWALRGGWHYHVAKTGLTSTAPVKDQHSHPGDAMGYGAAVLFPVGRVSKPAGGASPNDPAYFAGGNLAQAPMFGGPRLPPGFVMPKHGQRAP